MSLLVLQRGRHEQRQYLVEESIGTKLPSLVRDLTQCRLGEMRGKRKREGDKRREREGDEGEMEGDEGGGREKGKEGKRGK